MDSLHVIRKSMRALVQSFGCYDAAAEAINARWGGGSSKGTISKKMSGQLDWTIADMIALEGAAGQYPITRFLSKRMHDHPAPLPADLVTQSGVIAQETGEAISAILAAGQSLGANDLAQAIVEAEEAKEALEATLSRLNQIMREGT